MGARHLLVECTSFSRLLLCADRLQEVPGSLYSRSELGPAHPAAAKADRQAPSERQAWRASIVDDGASGKRLGAPGRYLQPAP